MKTILLLLAAAAVGQATTWYTCPGTISAAGYYDLGADLTTGSTTCITITNVSSYYYGDTGVEINCNGHSVDAANYSLNVSHNSAGIYWHDCHFLHQVNVGYNTNGSYYWTTWSDSDTYVNNSTSPTPGAHYEVPLQFQTNPKSYVTGATMTRTNIAVYDSPDSYISGVTMDLTGTFYYFLLAGVLVQNSNNVTVQYVDVTGAAVSSLGDKLLDNVISLRCTSGTCSGGTFAYNTSTENIGSAFETLGSWTGVLIDHNAFSNVGWPSLSSYPGAMVACYTTTLAGTNTCGLDSFTISNNTISGIGSNSNATRMFYFQGNSGAGVFTNNIMTNNTFTGGASFNVFGVDNTGTSTVNFATVTGNTITNTVFGATCGMGIIAPAVYMQTTGFTEGNSTGNYCGTQPTNSNLTCHRTPPC